MPIRLKTKEKSRKKGATQKHTATVIMSVIKFYLLLAKGRGITLLLATCTLRKNQIIHGKQLAHDEPNHP
jgi:hypothetical protein